MRNFLPLLLLAVLGVAACEPTVRVEAPKEPITINLNVNIEHKVKVQIDKDLENTMTQNKDIF